MSNECQMSQFLAVAGKASFEIWTLSFGIVAIERKAFGGRITQ